MDLREKADNRTIVMGSDGDASRALAFGMDDSYGSYAGAYWVALTSDA
mgnify:CR=1 FL=1